MGNIFKKYFKRNLLNEEFPPQELGQGGELDSDTEAFNNSFADEANLDKLNAETAQTTVDPNQQAKLLKKADAYAAQISEKILPTLRTLHQDLISGVFKTINPDIKGIANITEDLAKLSEALRGRTRDAILKSEKDSKKQQ